MSALMTAVAAVLLALWLLTTMANWLVVLDWYRRGKRKSMVLVAGGVFAVAGCVLWPGIDARWAVVLVILDPGCFVVPALCHLLDRHRGKT
jgi:hypothetical protein